MTLAIKAVAKAVAEMAAMVPTTNFSCDRLNGGDSGARWRGGGSLGGGPGESHGKRQGEGSQKGFHGVEVSLSDGTLEEARTYRRADGFIPGRAATLRITGTIPAGFPAQHAISRCVPNYQ